LNLNASVVAPAFIHLVQVGPGAAPPLSLTRHGS
jgi:hypothetical protein